MWLVEKKRGMAVATDRIKALLINHLDPICLSRVRQGSILVFTFHVIVGKAFGVVSLSLFSAKAFSLKKGCRGSCG